MKKQAVLIGVVIVIVVIFVSFTFFLIEWDSPNGSGVLEVTTNPFLWRIEGDNPSYLFGSMHLADERLLTLPDIVIEAIDDAEVVYAEVKLDQETTIKSGQLSRLPSGQTLDDLLPQDVASRLDSYLSTKGLASSAFANYKVWFVTNYIALLDELENLLKNPSLDQYIWNLAISKGKDTDGIETVEEQINIFDSLTLDEQIDMLNDTLDALEEYANSGESPIDDMKDAYIEGNLEVLQDLMFSDYEENNYLYVKFKSLILTDRNYNITQRITQLITDNPNTQYFFTIGAGHYYGEDGIITLLENEGFTITRVQFNECDSCDPGETMINQRCYEPYVVK